MEIQLFLEGAISPISLERSSIINVSEQDNHVVFGVADDEGENAGDYDNDPAMSALMSRLFGALHVEFPDEDSQNAAALATAMVGVGDVTTGSFDIGSSHVPDDNADSNNTK